MRLESGRRVPCEVLGSRTITVVDDGDPVAKANQKGNPGVREMNPSSSEIRIVHQELCEKGNLEGRKFFHLSLLITNHFDSIIISSEP